MNIKRIIIAVVLAVCSIVLAVPSTASAVADNIIDTTKLGYITIYKYEMADVSKATSKGTGEESDKNNVPAGAKLFKGVEFTVKQIAGLDDKYFQGKGTPLPSPTTAKTMAAIGKEIKVVTDDNGVAKFNDLPLGVYFVSETASPNQVLKKTADFVISLPFTDVLSQKWVYNAYVHPKNETKYATLKIHKSDYKTGSSLSDTYFKLERKNEKGVYEVVKDNIKTDNDGNVSVNDLPVNSFYRITETKPHSLYILDRTNNICTAFINSEGKVCDADKKPLNIKGDSSLFEFLPNTKPEIDKYIDKSKGQNSELVKETTFGHRSNNDRNYYTIIVTTPNIELNKLKLFTVTDQINDTLQSPKVESVREENTTTLAEGKNTYTTEVTKGNHVTVKFSTAAETVIKPNKKYYISISCFHALTKEPILNHATLEYTTDIDKTEKIDTPDTKTISAAYEFLKTDEKGQPLANAVFSVYRSKDDAMNNRNPIPVTTGEGEPYSTTFKSKSDGKVRFIYMEFGDNVISGAQKYWVSEIQSPEGYMLLAKPFEITVNRQSGSYDYTQTKVENIKKPDLPKTGGYGAFVLPLFGLISLATAGVLFFIKKKKSSGDN